MSAYPFPGDGRNKHEIFVCGALVLSTADTATATARWVALEAAGTPATARVWSGDDYRDARNRHGSGRAP